MIVGISVTASLFIITIDEVTTLTKNKDDIYCRVSPDDSTVVEIWETSVDESKRNIIFSSVYSNFNPPTGASASIVCAGINTLLKSNTIETTVTTNNQVDHISIGNPVSGSTGLSVLITDSLKKLQEIAGASGSFTTVDLKTVTVTNGIITAIT